MRITTTAIIVLCSFYLNAQQGYRSELGVGGTFKIIQPNAIGFAVSFEPTIGLNDQVSVGLDLDASTFLMHEYQNVDGRFTTPTSFIGAFSLKSSIKLGKSKVQPLIGLSVGYYFNQVNGAGGEHLDKYTGAYQFYHVHINRSEQIPFGIAPFIGLAFENCSVEVQYNLINGIDELHLSYSSNGTHKNKLSEIRRDYFTIQMKYTFNKKN